MYPLAEPDSGVVAVDYDRSEMRTGVVHFGVGGFHRAHQGVYTDGLARADAAAAAPWGTVGVGVLPGDARMRDVLARSGGIYHVVTREGAAGGELREAVTAVGTLKHMLLGPEDPGAVVSLLAEPGVRVVSLTITEFGYAVPCNETDAALVRGEEVPAGATALPTTFGYIAAGLARRFARGLPPFTVMSCDNLPGNGVRARERVLDAVARGGDAALLEWASREGRFPSTMVDRITPATTPGDVEALSARHGVEDEWPVVCEPFKQWVVEDSFVGGREGRPAWELAGAQLVPDVHPHELAKIRLLNVVHSVMCYPALLLGLEHVHEAVTHPLLKAFLRQVQREEVLAPLGADPRMAALLPELPAYAEAVLDRFANVAVKDQLARIAMDMTQKFYAQGRPLVADGLATGVPMRGLALAVACWLRFVEREVAAGEQVRDAGASAVLAALGSEGGAGAVLGLEEVFGALAADGAWRASVMAEYELLGRAGVEAALVAYREGVAPQLVSEDVWETAPPAAAVVAVN